MTSSESSLPQVPVTRRTLVKTAAGLAVLPALSPIMSGCATTQSNREDPLYTLLRAAQRDISAAQHLPQSAAYRQLIISTREVHVAALKEEIHRQEKLWKAPSATQELAASGPSTIEQLRQHLRQSAQQALDVVTEFAGYRAGLAGSIAASCTTLDKVVLA